MSNSEQEKIRVSIGLKIKALREAKKLTQAELADLAGIKVNYFAMIERGEVNFTFDKIYRIIKALKIKASQILPF